MIHQISINTLNVNTIRLNINGREITALEGQTILDAAQSAGIEIPTLCNDERVKAYGSCGVCVVEATGMPRLLRACSTVVSNGMIIDTESKRAVAARKAALELLLSDHTGDCRPPCSLACPAETDCQGYVGLIANGEYRQALELIKEKIPLPASIGRVCPHPCEEACRRKLVEQPINIAHLKYFAADADLNSKNRFIPEIKERTGKNIAIIGGGPGGLTCAYFLRRSGHDVTVYDSMPEMGGMLRYGIPEYRLPKSILAEEVRLIEDMGVNMVNNTRIGSDITLENLRTQYDAVVIAIGAWISTKLRCPGEDSLEGVIGGIEFLKDVHFDNIDLSGKRIAVVGGGNVAMDACRTAVRLNADTVYNIYRRTKNEMPAEEIEIEEAEEEGVIFKNLTNPIEIIGDNNKVSKIRLQIMELGQADESGRRSPVAVEGAEEILDVDMVIVAIGQTNNNSGFEDVNLTKRNTIAADSSTFATNLDGVFAIGDATNKGADIAITAIGEAKKAAKVIDTYLDGKKISSSFDPYFVKQEITAEDLSDKEKIHRIKMRHKAPAERKTNFDEVNFGYNESEAVAEAKRCLECGCHDYFECKLIKYANNYPIDPLKYDGAVNKKPILDEHPYIIRNMNKCILCGLCVGICDEVMGVGALGLSDRGFVTSVKSGLDSILSESECISCGQCVAVCPTGALGEKIKATGHKQVPLSDKKTLSTCSQCGVGCPTVLSSKGNTHIRCLPATGKLLCEKGRFGFIEDEKRERILKPLIRRNNELCETTFDEAYKYICENISKYESQEIAVAVSDKYTNEEINAIKQLAKKSLNTENLICSNYSPSGLSKILGYDGSTCKYDELMSTDVIILVADNVTESHTLLGIKIKQARESGIKFIYIHKNGTNKDLACQWADIDIATDDYFSILEQIQKDSSEDKLVSKVSDLYKNAKNAIIVFVQNDLTFEEQQKVAEIAKESNHINRPRNGIIQMKQNANGQGIATLGINKSFTDIDEKVKAIITFGDNFNKTDLKKHSFLCVQSAYKNDLTEVADVVLPGVVLLEKKGSYTSSDGSILQLNSATPIQSGVSIIDMADSIRCMLSSFSE